MLVSSGTVQRLLFLWSYEATQSSHRRKLPSSLPVPRLKVKATRRLMRYCKLATPKSWLSRQLTPRYSWPAVCRVWRFFFTPRDEGSFTQSGVSIGHQSDSRLSRFSLKKTNVFEARVLYGKNNEHSSVPVPWLFILCFVPHWHG